MWPTGSRTYVRTYVTYVSWVCAGVWLQFDFAKDDVPERDPSQVAQDIEETQEILTAIQTVMVHTYNVHVVVRV